MRPFIHLVLARGKFLLYPGLDKDVVETREQAEENQYRYSYGGESDVAHLRVFLPVGRDLTVLPDDQLPLCPGVEEPGFIYFRGQYWVK